MVEEEEDEPGDDRGSPDETESRRRVDEQGRPRDLCKNVAPGGWQEDSHTDVIHNYVDALRAYPDWGEAIGAEP